MFVVFSTLLPFDGPFLCLAQTLARSEGLAGSAGPAAQPILPARSPQLSRAVGDFFFSRTTSAISNTTTPVAQIPSPWPPRKPPSALPRRTSPLAPRSARVRYSATALNATRDHHPRQWAQKSQREPWTDNIFLQASSSSALPASSLPSTTPSSTSPISRTSEQHPPDQPRT